MRKTALLATFILSLNGLACGSSDDPAGNDVLTDVPGNDVEQDNGTDIPGEDTTVDNGTDTAWPDMGQDQWVEDVPEGPFYPKEEGDLVTVTNGTLTVVLNLANGTFNIGKNPGFDGIINGHSEVQITSIEGTSVISSIDPGPRATWQATWGTDGLDDGVTVIMETLPTGAVGGLRTYIALHRNNPSVTARVMVGLPVREGFHIDRLSPVVTKGSDGAGLFLGAGTASAALITNGTEIAYDGFAEAMNVTEAVETMNGPGLFSNWNASICTASGSCAIAGFLNVTRGFGGVAVASVPNEAFAIGEDAALSLFELRSTSVQGVLTSPSRVLASETAYIDFTDDLAAGLARYGDAIKTYNQIAAIRQAPAMASAPIDLTPVTSDAISTMIPEFAAATSKGLGGFIVDRGWDNAEKEPDSASFPNHGSENAMKWLAGQIKGAGLVPGVGLSPFVFDKSSAFYSAHTEWFAEPHELAVVRLGIGNNAAILDVSNADASAWVVNYVKTAVQTWGYEYVKLYDADLASLGQTISIDEKTGLAAVIDTLKAIRTAVGNDVYIELAGGTMIGLGIVDAVSASFPTYASWTQPGSKVDASLLLGAASWAHRTWMTAFIDVVPGRQFKQYPPDNSWPTAEGQMGIQFAAVTGGTPEYVGALPRPHLDLEAAGLTIGGAYATDYTTSKIPESWYSNVQSTFGSLWLAGFFRFAGNTGLFSLSALDGNRARALNLPVTTGQSVVLETVTGLPLTKSGACINPDGATVNINADNSSIVYTIREVGQLDAPVFLGLRGTMAGGFSRITEISNGTGSQSVSAAILNDGNVDFVFAVPKGATPTVEVVGGNAEVEDLLTTVCSDLDIYSASVNSTDAIVGVTVSI